MMTEDEAMFLTDAELGAAYASALADVLLLGRERARRHMERSKREADARPTLWQPENYQRDHDDYTEEMSIGGRPFRSR